jgi:hypothetical protein
VNFAFGVETIFEKSIKQKQKKQKQVEDVASSSQMVFNNREDQKIFNGLFDNVTYICK